MMDVMFIRAQQSLNVNGLKTGGRGWIGHCGCYRTIIVLHNIMIIVTMAMVIMMVMMIMVVMIVMIGQDIQIVK